jgi:hypothetical protein
MCHISNDILPLFGLGHDTLLSSSDFLIEERTQLRLDFIPSKYNDGTIMSSSINSCNLDENYFDNFFYVTDELDVIDEVTSFFFYYSLQ